MGKKAESSPMSDAERMIYAASWACSYVGNHRPGEVAAEEAHRSVMQFRAMYLGRGPGSNDVIDLLTDFEEGYP